MPNYFIGIMCGTSLDSLDISLLRDSNTSKIELFKSYRLDNNLVQMINVCKKNNKNQKLFREIDDKVTEFIIVSLYKFLKNQNKDIEAIGFPGITILHNPSKRISKTLGNCQKIANHFKIKVVGDFRLSDMKSGGQGAPLAPYFHNYISVNKKKFINILNLGGFGNFTGMTNNKLVAFDTGPANYIYDGLMREKYKIDYDKSGKIAKNGKVDNNALLKLLSHQYFKILPPKSTGFEMFNLKWFYKTIKRDLI